MASLYRKRGMRALSWLKVSVDIVEMDVLIY